MKEELNKRIKNNLEAVESDNEKLMAHIELIEAENAKLIAERDMLKLCADQNEDEVKKMHAELKEYLANKILDTSDKKLLDRLLAEREAMMKQEPYCYASLNGEDFSYSKSHTETFVGHGWKPLFERPLPAQQIPEGYTAIKTEVFKWLLGENGDFGDHSEYAPVYSWRKRLRDSVLSASQPKGES